MTSENVRQPSNLNCIFLARSEGEQRLVAGLVGPAGIHVDYAASLEQADRLMASSGAAVLLVDAGLGAWENAMEMLRTSHPAAALVLVSGEADEGFWIDALEKGAYDLVLKPFVGAELRRILENAAAHSRYGVAQAAHP